MNADRLEIIEELFHKAKALDPEDRASFLDDRCIGALDLRAEVESLLAHSDRSTSEMDLRPDKSESLPTIVDRGKISEGPGARIGNYKILQQIGEGGFGVVYMAEQREPVQRMVALKIIKLGMDTKQVIARFEAERQALAMMDHPSIAKVLEAGATETGRPYFVMELVKGIPITDYCDKNKLSMRARLNLFTEVCHAVQHAHQKGVIHRDLKPSNILVTLHDILPVPKVIDFGIAKATSRRLTEKTLFTEFRQMIGTPEYMSPDQADISGLDVDTRTDIYSLGVLLYELLTGTTPFDPKTLRKAAQGEMQRIIGEVDPPKPSTRMETLATSGEGSSIAQYLGTEAGVLSRQIRGDLDWIVMKAIEKDRTRRYQSASELAADIQRFLISEPVLAGPPSVKYKLGKFVRRHRLGVAAGVFVSFALISGTGLAVAGFIAASKQAQIAKEEAIHSNEVSDFLQKLTVQSQDNDSQGSNSIHEIVERGKQLFGDDHSMVGSLLMTRATFLDTTGRLEEAILAQREALSFYQTSHNEDDPNVAAALSRLGKMLAEQREYLEAEKITRYALQMNRNLYGNESELTAEVMVNLTEILTDGGGSERRDEIKQLWEETIQACDTAFGYNNRKTVLQRAYYGKWLHENGYTDESRPILEESIAQIRSVLGNDNMTLFAVQNALAQHHLLVGQDYLKTAQLVEEMISTGQQLWDTLNGTVVSITLQLAIIWQHAEELDKAGDVISNYMAKRNESTWTPNMAAYMIQEQVVRELDEWFEENPDVGKDFIDLIINDAHQLPNMSSKRLAKALRHGSSWLIEHGFDIDAEAMLEESISLQRDADPEDSKYNEELSNVLVMLGSCKIRLAKPLEAEAILRESLEIRKDTLSEGNWLIASNKSLLGECLTDQGRYEDAEPFVLDGYQGMKGAIEVPEVRTKEGLGRIIKLYESWGKPQLAQQWREQSKGPVNNDDSSPGGPFYDQ